MEHDQHEPVAETAATQWHPAFFGSLQIEFEKEDEPIRKNIGRIFLKHNIIEYKSPDDYLSIDDFYKVYGYTCFYKYDTSTVDEVKITDVTISLVSEGYPYKLIKHLEKVKKYEISKYENGIYYVKGAIIPIQIIVKKRLSKTENLWLASLTNKLSQTQQAAILLKEYNKHRANPLYRSVMNTIVTTNAKMFEEGNNMCQALEEIMDRKIAKEAARVNNLTLKLAELGRMDDIIKAAKDENYQHQLFEEFGL